MRSLNVEYSELERNFNKDIPFHLLSNLVYILGAILYHCEKLAEVYCKTCRSFASFPHLKLEEDKAIFSGNPETYYEFDALFTDAVRLYESMRYIIWSSFGTPKIGVPRSYEDILKRIPSHKQDFSSDLFN